MNSSRGKVITEESFRIIRSRLGDFSAGDDVTEIVIRIAHTTGDVEFGKSCYVPKLSVKRGIEAISSGCPIVTDVEMVRTGIRAALAEKLGCRVHCFLNDTEVIDGARQSGETRSALGMRQAAECSLLNGAVVAIGNAPTALFALLSMIESGRVKPALVVGIPVGFVGALESKQALYDSGYPCITNLSERGGSPIAAAIVNGLLFLAEQRAEQRG
ncbi:precorrin-8X methylmutase [Sediminispirochaeta bajacaliforniensis]|uniref:precorrin-8X methylmutase n=1 Tax=Sediminispirochaeta bajacaliforniensis TaxID=148 RepID=UPI00036C64B7|nr:precorrin-8X methylmutase [Sediminispirochaeta bajacaliforniensis]